MTSLKRFPIKYIRDFIKKDYKLRDECYVCGTDCKTSSLPGCLCHPPVTTAILFSKDFIKLSYDLSKYKETIEYVKNSKKEFKND